MINICTSSPVDFSDNAVYVVSHVLHIEQWYPFVTLIKLVERAYCLLFLCIVIRRPESNAGRTSESFVYRAVCRHLNS